MNILWIDFETYYDNDYSLRKLTYPAYIKDERFMSRGASVALDNEPIRWLDDKDLPAFFDTLDWSNLAVCAHNTMFDGSILAWHYGRVPSYWMDTMSMANYVFDVPNVSLANLAKMLNLQNKGDALDATKGKRELTEEEAEALADYALGDLIICRDAYHKMKDFMPKAEHDLIDLTLRMYIEPKIILDTPLLERYLVELIEGNAKRLDEWTDTVLGDLSQPDREIFEDKKQTMFTSAKEFRNLLMALNQDVPQKFTRATEFQAKASLARISKASEEAERLRALISEEEKRIKELYEERPKASAKRVDEILGLISRAEKRIGDREEKMVVADSIAKQRPVKKGALVSVPALAKTDEAFIELADSPDAGVAAAVAARLQLMSTINETRSKRLLDMAKDMHGLVPVPLKYCGARTNRWSGTQKINMQNLPARGRDRTLRNALTAPNGYKIIAADLAQIEPRVLAWLAGEQFLLDTFAEGKDFYTALYTRTFGGDYDEMYAGYKAEDFEWTQKRNVGKACGLGLGFGMGAKSFQRFAKVAAKQVMTEAEAEEVVSAYRASVPNITQFWKNAGDMIPAMASNPTLNALVNKCRYRRGAVILPSGRFLRYDDLRSEEVVILDDDGEIVGRRKQWMYGAANNRSYIYDGKAVENLVQAFARDVVADMALSVDKLLDKRHNEGVVLLVHDEIVMIVREDKAEDVAAEVKTIMSTTPSYAPGLPLNCSIKIADNYGEAK